MLELSPQVFAILSALIEEKTGLHYGLLDRELLGEKASTRALEAGFDSLLDYYYFLRYDPGGAAELTALTDALVVGETYLFREYPALKVLLDTFIAPWCQAGRRPRIWSAASATGEEPFTLAMMLAQRNLLGQVTLTASDISGKSLARARSGKLGRRAVRGVPEPELLARYVRSMDDGWEVDRALVDAIEWKQLNLTDSAQVRAQPPADAILCRNVLIYFRDETIRRVVGDLANRLVSGGILLVGVSESLLRFSSTLIGEEHGGCFVYRKAGP